MRFDAKCLCFPNWLVEVVSLALDTIVVAEVLKPPVCVFGMCVHVTEYMYVYVNPIPF